MSSFVVAKHPNAGSVINGVAFKDFGDGTKVSEAAVDGEVLELFKAHPALFELKEAAKAAPKTAQKPKADEAAE